MTVPSQQHVARRVTALQQRRLQLFSAALRTAAVVFLAAVIFGGWIWFVFVGVSILTVSYAAVLRQAKRQRDHAQMVVRELGTYRGIYGDNRVTRERTATSRTVRLRSYKAQ